MPRKPLGFDDVRNAARALPDIEDGTTLGLLSLKVRGRLMACTAIHKSAEPNSLVVKVDVGTRGS
jgi:hypothetical protein